MIQSKKSKSEDQERDEFYVVIVIRARARAREARRAQKWIQKLSTVSTVGVRYPKKNKKLVWCNPFWNNVHMYSGGSTSKF